MTIIRIALFVAGIGVSQCRGGTDEDWLALNENGSELQRLGNYKEAEAVFRQALALAETAPVRDGKLAVSWNNLGLIQHETGRYKEAEQAYRTCIKLIEDLAGPDAPELVSPLSNLATLYVELGKVRPAIQATAHLEAVVLKKPAPVIAWVRIHAVKGSLAGLQKRPAEAEEHFLKALALAEGKPELAYEVASALNDLAVLDFDKRRYDRARQYLERSIAISESYGRPHSPRVVSAYANLALVALAQKRNDEAVRHLEHAIRITEAANSTDQYFLSHAYEHLAIALRRTGQKQEARAADNRARSFAAADLAAPGRHTIDVSAWRPQK